MPTRIHLQKIYEQTGNMPPELEPIDCHPSVRYIADYWFQLNRRRKGMDPISFQEIYSWSWLRGIRLNAFELDVLERLEALYYEHFLLPKVEDMKRTTQR